MEQFIWFLGRFHVLVLHLPLGILTLAAALEVLVRFRRFKSLESALPAVWAAGALSAIATVILGYMHAREDSFQEMPAVDAHRWAGIYLCVASCLVAVTRARLQPLYERYWGAPVALILVLMLVTGHLGGNLTHGDTYLVQFAPGPIRVLAGLPANAGPRPRPRDLASADIYLDVIQPMLEQRCSTCHNNSKRSGGLSVASYETLMKGGSKGPVIKASDPSGSDLLRRVSLAPSSSDFMPKEGKTPLNNHEVAAIQWWIQQGAPQSASVGSLRLTADAASAIGSLIGASGEEPAQEIDAGTSGGALPTVAEADPDIVARVVAEGFIVRRIYKGSTLLDVDYTSPQRATPAVLADLARLAPNILRLNLRSAGITDSTVQALATFKNLRHLRLEKNEITDAAAKDIATLGELTSLNLTNTRVTDRGFNVVAQLPKLTRLYVWGTPVTAGAVERFKAEHKQVDVYAGLTARDVPAPGKIIPPDF